MSAVQQFARDICSNRILLAVTVAWIFAQALKAVLYWLMNHEWRWERLFGSGGMPSSHGATVCALSTGVLLQYGAASFQFAISIVLTIIVLHDARGVRLEAGRQAEILNEMMRNWHEEHNPFSDKVLKVLVGHTPLQVLVGSLLGIAIGLILH